MGSPQWIITVSYTHLPSFNTFYQMVTMFDISVDQYFYPSKNKGLSLIHIYFTLIVKAHGLPIIKRARNASNL